MKPLDHSVLNQLLWIFGIWVFMNPILCGQQYDPIVRHGTVIDGTAPNRLTANITIREGHNLRDRGEEEPALPTRTSEKTDPKAFSNFEPTMHEFLRQHRIPGAAVAVTDNGKLMYSAGFGYSDLSNQQPVEPDSLFRIASVSKPITAVAILQLVEKGHIHLHDRVFLKLNLINTNDQSTPEGLTEITVEQVLQHRGGWDRNQSFDPMFQSVRFANQLGIPSPADAQDVIRAMLSQDLDFKPGNRYAYSNFGYCLLGRLIEAVTDQTYEQYVQTHVLKPLDIHSMRIGRTHLDQRFANEVRYYHPHSADSVFSESIGQKVPSQYGGWYLEAMDSHGGWIASAEDLAKFAAAFDDPENCPILRKESIEKMHGRPEGSAGYEEDGRPKNVYYSLGWSNRILSNQRANRWHSGSLPGTTSIMIRRHDGKNFIGLLNTRVTPTDKKLGLELDRLLHKMVDAAPAWNMPAP